MSGVLITASRLANAAMADAAAADALGPEPLDVEAGRDLLRYGTRLLRAAAAPRRAPGGRRAHPAVRGGVPVLARAPLSPAAAPAHRRAAAKSKHKTWVGKYSKGS